MEENDFSWAKDTVFGRIKEAIKETSIEEALSPHIPPDVTLIPKENFIEAIEKLNADITNEDIVKLAEQLFNKEIDCIEIEHFYSNYKEFTKTADEAHKEENYKEENKEEDEAMEEVRKAVSEGFIDVVEVFKELDIEEKQLVTLFQFEAALVKMKVKLTAEQIKSLFEKMDKADTGKISYTRFASELESYSLSRVLVPNTHPSMEIIRKLRNYIKNHSTNTMQLIFKDLVKPNLDGKRWITKKDFKSALAKMKVTLNTTQFDELVEFLDRSHVDQIDYDYFYDVLGYIQPLEELEENKEEALPEVGDSMLMVRKMVEEITNSAQKNDYNLQRLFTNKDYDNNGTVSKIDFMDIIRIARGGLDYNDKEYLILSKHFEDPMTHNIQYNGFLSQADQALHKFKKEKKVTNVQWAAKILGEICIFLYYKGQTSYEYFRPYGLNPENKSVTFEGFEQGIRDMQIGINEKELDKLKEDLDTDGDRTISAEELAVHLDERRGQILETYKKEVMGKVEGFVRARDINLKQTMKRHDSYDTKRISAFDFENELRIQFKGLLKDLQYKYLTAKYKVDSEKVAYMEFINDITAGKLTDEETKAQRSMIIDKLRENIRLLNLKTIEQLLKNGADKKLYSVNTLLDLFHRSLLPMKEYAILERIIDTARSGKFTLDEFCNLFWTNKDEEDGRDKAHEEAYELNKKIRRFCVARNIDLRKRFEEADDEGTGYLSVDNIKKELYEVNLKLSYKQLSALLYHQGISTNSKWYKNYNDLLSKIEESVSARESVHESTIKKSKEESQFQETVKEAIRDEMKEAVEESMKEKEQVSKVSVEEQKEPRLKDIHFRPPKEIELDEDLLNYLAQQFEVLRRFLQDKRVDIRAEFSQYEQDGNIDFEIFCQILSSHDIDLDNQDTLNVFYSYLKEDKKGKISAGRLYDALLRGKRLVQYKPKSARRVVQKEEHADAEMLVKKLADHMKEKTIALTTLKKHAVNGKTLKKEHLDKTLKEINFSFTKEELNVLFKIIAIKDEVTGSAAHLMTIVNEQLVKKNPKKLQLDKEVFSILNKEIIDKSLPRADLKRLLNINDDGYIDKDDFANTLHKNGFEIHIDKLQKIFLELDVHKVTALSIDYILLHITGIKYGSDDKERHLPLDEQISSEAEKLFQRLDESHNGVMLSEGLYRALSASSHNRCTDEEAKEIMKTLDTRRNNSIAKENFISYMIERIKSDTLIAEDDMVDIREELGKYDLDDNGYLAPDEIYAILSKECPAIQMEDLEEIFEKLDPNKERRIDRDEFVDYVCSPVIQAQIDKNSRTYRAILTLKYQRRLTANEFMNCFEKMSTSVLYTPSFILKSHKAGRNLPSESFKVTRDTSGLGYIDIQPSLDINKKPTNILNKSEPGCSGYIIVNEATGVPIPDERVLSRENIVSRVLKVVFYNSKSTIFAYGSTTILASWSNEAEDTWTFNDAGKVGTNPITFKWGDVELMKDIDIVFEFVASIK